jgi:ATP10 protein
VVRRVSQYRNVVIEDPAMRPATIRLLTVAALSVLAPACLAQSLPTTLGETLSGKPVVIADAVRGHIAVLVAGFSHEGGMATGDWIKAIRTDPAFAGVSVYQVAMLEGAPAFVRGMIKSGMKKGMPPEEQDYSVVLIQNQKLWEDYFGVTTDKDPYVVLIDSSGKVMWHGHGPVGNLEPQLKAALH